MSAMTRSKLFDGLLFEEYDIGAKSLSIYRIIFSLYALLFFNAEQIELLGGIPNVFYHPPYGPMLLFEGFPTYSVFSIITFLVYFGAFALLLGYRTKWASLLTGFSLAVGYGFLYSLGKINHNMLLILVPVVMAWSRWGAYYSVDSLLGRAPEETEIDGWPVAVMAVCLGVALFIAGLAKILGGWLDPSLQAVQTHIVRNFYLNDRQALLASTVVNFDWPVFWELVDWATVTLEVALLLLVWNKSLFRGGIGLVVFFHLGVLLTMNISFQHQIFVYALFVEWEKTYPFNRLSLTRREPFDFLKGWHFGLLIGVVSLGYYYIGSPMSALNRVVPVDVGVSPTALILMMMASLFTVWKVFDNTSFLRS